MRILKENIQKADTEIAELDKLIEVVREVSLKCYYARGELTSELSTGNARKHGPGDTKPTLAESTPRDWWHKQITLD